MVSEALTQQRIRELAQAVEVLAQHLVVQIGANVEGSPPVTAWDRLDAINRLNSLVKAMERMVDRMATE